jgi:hypothetical protein
MSDDLDQGFEEEESQQVDEPNIAELQKKLAKLEQDNYKLREERRRAEFETKYGAEIAAEVADLPEDKRETWAEKLLKLQTSDAPPEQNEPAPEETPKVEVPAGLAAVAQAPATGSAETESMSLEDFRKHVESDGLVVAAQRHGHKVKFPNADNPLATGQATRISGSYRPPS